jgi:TonB family protein
LDQPAAPRAFGTKVAPLIEAVSDLVGKRRVVAGAVVTGVLAVLLLAVTKNHAWGELQQAPVVGAATAKQPQADHLQASTASALSLPVRDPAVSANAASRVPAPRVVATKPRVEERVAGKKAEEPSKTDSKKFSLPTIASSLMSHLDSVVSKAGTAPREDNFNVQPTAIAFGSQHLAADEQATVPLRARLIGELPTPRIPQQATDVEGEVRVRFTVDAQGQPVMSTFAVVTSPHPLLTAAVRRVVPEMRFDPARSGGADGRAIADVVETSFRFARASR